MKETTGSPTLTQRLADPRPALILGTLAWAAAAGVVIVTGDRWANALPTTIAGVVVGCLGYGLFALQRRAARRGSRGAQQGLL
ncbi:DUF2530 domain-containing protein [Rhodococcus sp. NPDC049939]|uniref:DUF2530 domain-containing protein n=1 Tax=Rhodococcus sp. NPDC049939 TaxID=3155511 RepID=UPI0033EFC27D